MNYDIQKRTDYINSCDGECIGFVTLDGNTMVVISQWWLFLNGGYFSMVVISQTLYNFNTPNYTSQSFKYKHI